ncbi:hypothetical protein BC829DRAFT_2099 [Chytridium lagenaria]|nr:hypothetical protein BC829DRAFT_2099 [Chytridium lagenaria]
MVMRHNVTSQLALLRAMDDTNDQLEKLLRLEIFKRRVNCCDAPYRSLDLRYNMEVCQNGVGSSINIAPLSWKPTIIRSRNVSTNVRKNSQVQIGSFQGSLRNDDELAAESVHVIEQPDKGGGIEAPAPSPGKSPGPGVPLFPRPPTIKGTTARFNVDGPDPATLMDTVRPNYRRRMSQGIFN